MEESAGEHWCFRWLFLLLQHFAGLEFIQEWNWYQLWMLNMIKILVISDYFSFDNSDGNACGNEGWFLVLQVGLSSAATPLAWLLWPCGMFWSQESWTLHFCFVLFFRIVLGVHSPLKFQMNFRMSFSAFKEKNIMIVIGVSLKICITVW